MCWLCWNWLQVSPTYWHLWCKFMHLRGCDWLKYFQPFMCATYKRERERERTAQFLQCHLKLWVWSFFNRLWCSGCEFDRYKCFNGSTAPIFKVRMNKLKNHFSWCCTGVAEDPFLLWYDSTLLGNLFLTFWDNILY